MDNDDILCLDSLDESGWSGRLVSPNGEVHVLGTGTGAYGVNISRDIERFTESTQRKAPEWMPKRLVYPGINRTIDKLLYSLQSANTSQLKCGDRAGRFAIAQYQGELVVGYIHFMALDDFNFDQMEEDLPYWLNYAIWQPKELMR
jgi:hypothetical protein